LAVAAQSHSDVPTFAELDFADVVADNRSGVLAPRRPAIIAKLNAAPTTVSRRRTARPWI